MHNNYKQDEAALRNIISNHVTTTDPEAKIDLIIYYKNKKTAELLMKNSPKVDRDPLKKNGVVYQIICPENGCNHSYVGMTTTRLSKRLSVHLLEGNFHQHYSTQHGNLQRNTLLQSVNIIDTEQDRRRLRLKEALHIMRLKPSLNVTQETLLLPTNIRRNHPVNHAPAPVGIPVRPLQNPPPDRNPVAGAPQGPAIRPPPQNQSIRRSLRLQERALGQGTR